MMGIFIHLEVSKSVTKEAWNKVYEESLELVAAFPLAERGTVSYDDGSTASIHGL